MTDRVTYAFAVGPLGPRQLRVQRFTGREAMSKLYRFDVEVAAALPPATLEPLVLGRPARFGIRSDEKLRCIHGIVGAIRYVGPMTASQEVHRYRLRLVPRLWLLRKRKDSRVFRDLRVDQVIDLVLHPAGIATRWDLAGELPARDYCTQFEETDEAFVRRLCAENGVAFFFEQPPTLVDQALLEALDDPSPVPAILGGLSELLPDALSTELHERVVFTDEPRYPPMRDGSVAAEIASEIAGAVARALGELVEQVARGAQAIPGLGGLLGAESSFVVLPAPSLHHRHGDALTSGGDEWFHGASVDRGVRSTAAAYREYDPARPMARLYAERRLNGAGLDGLLGAAGGALSALAGAAGLGDVGAAVAGVAQGVAGAAAGAAGAAAGAMAGAAGGVAGAVVGAAGGVAGAMGAVGAVGAALGGGDVLDVFGEALRSASGGFVEGHHLESYEHDGRDLHPSWERGGSEPERILRQRRRRARVLEASTVCPRVESGHRLRLEEHASEAVNGEWVAVAVRHEGAATFHVADGVVAYRNTVECVPSAVAYLPPRPARRSVQVCLTATVVGPGGDDIHVNDRGEIEVQFHWERPNPRRGATCWIRTMHAWAGAGWGLQFIPRVGMEVVVVFEGGDPDKPLVLGSVYNGISPPPFTLPAHKTQSGIRTRSTPGGTGHNELQFEDAAGLERIYLRAERDYDRLVQRDRTATVQRDDRTTVQRDRSATVIGTDTVEASVRRVLVHTDHTTRVEGSDSTSVGGDAHTSLAGGRHAVIGRDDRLEVAGSSDTSVQGDAMVRTGGGATVLVGGHDAHRALTLLVEGPLDAKAAEAIELTSDQEIVLRVGTSSLRIAPGRIELAADEVDVRGKDVRLALAEGDAKLKAKGKCQVVADDAILMKASGASLGLASEAKLDASKVLLNSPAQASDDVQVDDPTPTTIELVDQDGDPLPYQRFRVVYEDGEYTGVTDGEGRATVPSDASGEITFPDLGDAESA